jgi:hypothetical protein
MRYVWAQKEAIFGLMGYISYNVGCIILYYINHGHFENLTNIKVYDNSQLVGLKNCFITNKSDKIRTSKFSIKIVRTAMAICLFILIYILYIKILY